MAVRQFCSYQSKSGHSQWTLKPPKMAQTVGKACRTVTGVEPVGGPQARVPGAGTYLAPLVRELAALRHDLSNVKARLEADRLSCTAR
jgi:hypothetical protein